MPAQTAAPGRTLGWVLFIVFVIAVVMGTGPGIWLINPDVDGPSADFAWRGIPIIYLWGLLWYAVQLIVILTAAFTIWNEEA